MHSLKRHVWSTLALFGILAPSLASAQAAARSFEDLPRLLKPRQTVFVTDVTGRETKGRVTTVSGDSLTIGTRTFARETITRIRHTDSLANGALIGAAIGTGLATWDYRIDPSEPGNAIVFTVAIGLGVVTGVCIDALFRRGGTVLYRSNQPTPGLTISPLAGKERQGVLVSARF